jgi:hypothetical protein
LASCFVFVWNLISHIKRMELTKAAVTHLVIRLEEPTSRDEPRSSYNTVSLHKWQDVTIRRMM